MRDPRMDARQPFFRRTGQRPLTYSTGASDPGVRWRVRKLGSRAFEWRASRGLGRPGSGDMGSDILGGDPPPGPGRGDPAVPVGVVGHGSPMVQMKAGIQGFNLAYRLLSGPPGFRRYGTLRLGPAWGVGGSSPAWDGEGHNFFPTP